jgi:hypothetical protein
VYIVVFEKKKALFDSSQSRIRYGTAHWLNEVANTPSDFVLSSKVHEIACRKSCNTPHTSASRNRERENILIFISPILDMALRIG